MAETRSESELKSELLEYIDASQEWIDAVPAEAVDLSTAPVSSQASEDQSVEDLKTLLRAQLDWVDAIPSDVRAHFPVMPGFDRDHVDCLLVEEAAAAFSP